MERPPVEIPMRHAALIALLTATLLAAPASTLDTLWSFFDSMWAPQTIDEGCRLDPNGNCQPTPTTDSGCRLDPDGKPVCQEGI
jgi:hypothetical protein